MLSLHAAQPDAKHHVDAGARPRIGLAIAGGGPIGAMYELGALRALDEALIGLDLSRMDCYVGVSSGAFLAAGLANRITTEQMCRMFITGDSDDAVFHPETFLRPAFAEYGKRLSTLPQLGRRMLRDLTTSHEESRWSRALVRLGALVPNGLFDNVAVEQFLRDLFTRRGRSNDFRKLDRTLYVVAVDLDSGEAVRFGGEGWDNIPISQAVQASAALPGLYPPVTMRGRHFADGALRRTMHASLVLDQDVDMLIGLNPLVPFNAGNRLQPPQWHDDRRIAEGGLPVVLSQSLRTMLQSRMQVGLARYAQQYPHIDQLVFEPNAHDRSLFYANAFSFASRQRISDLAYRNTLADLRHHADSLGPVLARHGIRIDMAIAGQARRGILDGLPPPDLRRTDTTAQLDQALRDLEQSLPARKPVARRRPQARP